MKKTQKGITLIALVITIIVMLILVGVTISMAVNGGLFNKAGEATGKTKNAIEAEQTLANGKVKIDGVWYDSIDDYLAGKPSPEKGDVELSYTVEKQEAGMLINFQLKLLGIPEYNEETLENEFLKSQFLMGKTTQELIEIAGKIKTEGMELTAKQIYDNMLKSELDGITYEDFMKDKDAIIYEKYEVESADLYAKMLILDMAETNIGMDVGTLISYSKQLVPELVGKDETVIKSTVEGYFNKEYSFDQILSEGYGVEGITLDILQTQIDAACYGTELFTREEIMLVVAAKAYEETHPITVIYPDGTTENIIWYGYSDLTFNKTYLVTAEGEYKFMATGPRGKTQEIVYILEKEAPNPTETFSQIYETNTPITQGKYTAVIPKGFAVGTSEGINKIENGLVITDKVNSNRQSVGNEFVWIPVVLEGETQEEKEASFELIRKDGYYDGSLQTYVSEKSIREPYTNGYTDEEKEYKEMRTSVIENGGFYIGRYEAGIEPTYVENGERKINSARTDVANGTSPMVVKRDCYPYNYVGWGLSINDYTSDVTYDSKNQGKGALALSKAMYANKDVGVTSTLCYGIQWDAMVKFIGKDTETNSVEWGNYYDNAVTIDREKAKWTSTPSTNTTWTQVGTKAKNKSNSEMILLTTGASDEFEERSIYDVAGNVDEWTNEAHIWFADNRILRGSSCRVGGDRDPVSVRGYFSPCGFDYDVGFRPALYIK